MGLGDTTEGWGGLTRLLHWAMAVNILFMLGLGFYMANVKMDLMAQFALVQTHKSWGFVAFSLAVVRVGWRLAGPRGPDLPAEVSGWRRSAAGINHALLYILMFTMPLSGWLMASASPLQDLYGIQNMVFGLFDMPDPFVPGDAGLEDVFHWVHVFSALTLGLVLLLHVAAALEHHFIARNNVLRRMLIGR